MSFAIRWREDASGFVGPHAGKLASSPPHFDTAGAAEEVRRGMPNGDHAEVVEVADKAGEWVLDDDARARIDAELTAVAMVHEGKPACKLCGQVTNALDRFGLCSKTSDPHKDWRAGVRADEKTGARA